MKTAEEWVKYLDPNTSSKSCCYSPVHIEDIKQIQLDAIKEGMVRVVVFMMRREADKSMYWQTYNRLVLDITTAILTACDNLKEI